MPGGDLRDSSPTMLNRREFLISAGGAMALPLFANATPMPREEALLSLIGLPGIDGPALTAQQIANRPVLMTFWASWCPPCRDEFRHFNQVQRVYGDRGLTVLGVNVYEDFGGLSSPEKRARFLKQTAPTFPLIEGGNDLLQKFGGVDRIPTVFLFDASGELAYVFVHERDATKMHVTFGELKPVLDNLLG